MLFEGEEGRVLELLSDIEKETKGGRDKEVNRCREEGKEVWGRKKDGI